MTNYKDATRQLADLKSEIITTIVDIVHGRDLKLMQKLWIQGKSETDLNVKEVVKFLCSNGIYITYEYLDSADTLGFKLEYNEFPIEFLLEILTELDNARYMNYKPNNS